MSGTFLSCYDFFQTFGDISTILFAFGMLICTKANTSCFPFLIIGCINGLGHMLFFYDSSIFAEKELAIFNILKITMYVITWIVWNKHKDENGLVKVKALPAKVTFSITGLLLLLTLVLKIAGVNDVLSVALYIIYVIIFLFQLFRYREMFLCLSAIYAITLFSNLYWLVQKIAFVVENNVEEVPWVQDCCLTINYVALLLLSVIGWYNWKQLQIKENPNNE